MDKKYLIDNKILFSPEDKTLQSIASGEKRVLHSNVVRCLELLISQQGKVISQNELILYGWGNESYGSVTTAAYYQCFVNLRKNLKELDYQDELTITIRRVGIKLNPQVSISEVKEDKVQNDAFPEESHRTAPHQRITFTSRTHVLIVVLFLAITSAFSYALFIRQRNSIEGFSQITNLPSCFYYNDRNNDNEKLTKFLLENKYSCSENITHYISYFSASPRLSLFSCKNNICESTTYIVNL